MYKILHYAFEYSGPGYIFSYTVQGIDPPVSGKPNASGELVASIASKEAMYCEVKLPEDSLAQNTGPILGRRIAIAGTKNKQVC